MSILFSFRLKKRKKNTKYTKKNVIYELWRGREGADIWFGKFEFQSGISVILLEKEGYTLTEFVELNSRR